MAGGEIQRELLTLIRGFATEKSQGERRVAGLRKRIEELQYGLEVTNAQLEASKRSKEFLEQEIKGFEVELSVNESSIQAIESRISLIQDEISKIQSEVEALKSDENVCRDNFISQMADFNKEIREFYKSVPCTFQDEEIFNPSSHSAGNKVEDKQATVKIQGVLRELETTLENMISQTHLEEHEYQENQNNHMKVQQELVDLEKQASLLGEVVKEMKELQELTKQTGEAEEICTALGEKLQAMCACPSCHLDNVGALTG